MSQKTEKIWLLSCNLLHSNILTGNIDRENDKKMPAKFAKFWDLFLVLKTHAISLKGARVVIAIPSKN